MYTAQKCCRKTVFSWLPQDDFLLGRPGWGFHEATSPHHQVLLGIGFYEATFRQSQFWMRGRFCKATSDILKFYWEGSMKQLPDICESYLVKPTHKTICGDYAVYPGCYHLVISFQSSIFKMAKVSTSRWSLNIFPSCRQVCTWLIPRSICIWSTSSNETWNTKNVGKYYQIRIFAKHMFACLLRTTFVCLDNQMLLQKSWGATPHQYRSTLN